MLLKIKHGQKGVFVTELYEIGWLKYTDKKQPAVTPKHKDIDLQSKATVD